MNYLYFYVGKLLIINNWNFKNLSYISNTNSVTSVKCDKFTKFSQIPSLRRLLFDKDCDSHESNIRRYCHCHKFKHIVPTYYHYNNTCVLITRSIYYYKTPWN